MQAVKEKLKDLNAARKAKAEARAEEKAEKEIADARKNVAHEVRLAKEAEAEMDIHVEKAGKIAEKEISKHASKNPNVGYSNMNTTDHAMLEAANGPASTIN
ncbi:hypothetical protein AAZX31_06G290200 [Glycine max]|uniref:Uncharacterized protein n=2 Tax=Glycine subgen. Soja TaxID=1462606 RepID=K7KYE5_SOYBN|nr:late embryogenesis abundant protein 6 [Glycine max]XP_028234393.1 late embryogenesis abundant protein 6-like [Glycine soja]KAG5021063.1 hypothetical protein JHK87_016918 [Glycine soja]KAG5033416.1 hypothetical protein JHK85_017398 [Glycine max]KAG5047620.1 hypothetical protein JHK86_017026 [Glycine max]KAG5150099.1 hypothetical protein JHK82_016980 [Glycine max]KAH1128369.1 hypothetical protein GYH30_016778 [Glycine max]|eukprot:XP_006582378.1 late embryogenesis abundant protein 6 [Glycine max]